MGDIVSLTERRERKAAKQAAVTTADDLAEKSRRFDECLKGVHSLWEASLSKGDGASVRDRLMLELINRILAPKHILAVDPFVDEASRIEQSLGLRTVVHCPGTMGNYSNPGFVVVGVFNVNMHWSTPPFLTERHARWFNIILYLKLVEDGLVPDQAGYKLK